MLNFVDTDNNFRFQDRTGVSAITFGLQGAKETAPLDFQIETNEVGATFVAIRIDSLGNQISSTSIELSLLTYTVPYLSADGLTDFISDLDCGLYYYVINDRWESETFAVVDSLADGTDTVSDIQTNGLTFYDTTKDLDYQDRQGKSALSFGMEFGTNTKPLQFSYRASDSVSTFKAVRIDLNENVLCEVDLDPTLISSDGFYHRCTGEVRYDTFLSIGIFYFIVNDRYKSRKFEVVQLTCWNVENIIITNAIEEKPLRLDFDAELTGIENNLNVDIEISFSCGITTVSDTINLTDDLKHFIYNIEIPVDVNGNCTMTLSCNLCPKTYTETFYITPANVCYLELEDGTGDLDLETAGSLQLEKCLTDNVIKLLDADDWEFIAGGGINFLN